MFEHFGESSEYFLWVGKGVVDVARKGLSEVASCGVEEEGRQ